MKNLTVCVAILLVSVTISSASDLKSFAKRVIANGKQISKAGTDDAPCNQWKVSKCNSTNYAVVTECEGNVELAIKCAHDFFAYEFTSGDITESTLNQGKYSFQECFEIVSK